MRKLRVGDWVEVRSKEEILATLDKRGRMEGLPFMPQMFQYCGKKFQVFKRAHKTCDFVYKTWGRSLPDGIHLEARCDGEAYGGCQNACLLFWKEAWLKRVGEGDQPAAGSQQSLKSSAGPDGPVTTGSADLCTEADVLRGTRPEDCTDELVYTCQMTDVMEFTTLLHWWDIRQYLEDYTSGNISLDRLFRGSLFAAYDNLSQAGIGLGRPLRWLYEKVYSLPYPRSVGTIPAGQTTPTSTLNLQPGELVRVKSHKEICATLNVENKNRGMRFDIEMSFYCGGVYRVRDRLNKFLDEKTGKLTTLKSDAIVLEKVWCQSRYSNCRLFCPRSLYSWWREIWLERVEEEKK